MSVKINWNGHTPSPELQREVELLETERERVITAAKQAANRPHGLIKAIIIMHKGYRFLWKDGEYTFEGPILSQLRN